MENYAHIEVNKEAFNLVVEETEELLKTFGDKVRFLNPATRECFEIYELHRVAGILYTIAKNNNWLLEPIKEEEE